MSAVSKLLVYFLFCFWRLNAYCSLNGMLMGYVVFRVVENNWGWKKKKMSWYSHVEKTETFSYPCKLVFNSSVDEWKTFSGLSGSCLSGMVAIGPAIDPRPRGCCQDSLTITELLVCWSSSSVASLAAQCKQGHIHSARVRVSEHHRPKNLLCCLVKALILETRWFCAYLCNYNPRGFLLFYFIFLLLMPSLNLLGRGPYGDQSAFDASRYIHKEYIRTSGRPPKSAGAEHPLSTMKRLHPSHHFLLL